MRLLTKDERNLLHVLTLHPNGAVIRSPDGIKDLKALARMGLVHDVVEMAGGQFFGKINEVGKRAFTATASQ